MTPRNLALGALFVGPVVAAIDLGLSYPLVYRARESGSRVWLDLITILCAIAVAGGIAASRSVLRRHDGAAPVDRFLGVLGVALNAFFLLLVLAGYGIPKLVHTPWD